VSSAAAATASSTWKDRYVAAGAFSAYEARAKFDTDGKRLTRLFRRYAELAEGDGQESKASPT
jgi:hypothetical protein